MNRNNVKARDLLFEICEKDIAIEFTKKHHSCLPLVQVKPWMYAFRMFLGSETYAVALWNNPTARMLPKNWIELRRMTCSDICPKNTASRFLSLMVLYFKKHHKEHEKCISYQDAIRHKGTIYKAAGWVPAFVTKARLRNREYKRIGTDRLYRIDLNGEIRASSPKIRWEKTI